VRIAPLFRKKRAAVYHAGLRFFALDQLDNRFPALHGLRVLAIISVVQFHVTWVLAGEQGVKLDGSFTYSSLTIFFGMDLFFILSGFLIGSILLRSIETEGSQQLKRFYLRRAFRTFPSYYVVLTLLVLVTPLTAAQRAHLPYEYFYATNFMPLGRDDIVMFWGWSLALEEQFYLTVPLLFFVLSRLRSDRARVILLGAMWLSGVAIRLYIYFAGRPWTDLALYGALYFRTYTRFDTLVCGVLLAFVHRRWHVQIGAWLKDPFHRGILALPVLAGLWLLLFPAVFGAHHVQLVHVFAWGTITSIMYFCGLLILFHGEQAGIRGFLSHPLFRRIATLGYGVYLVHVPILDHAIVPAVKALSERGVSLAVLWPAALLILMLASLAVGYVMHILIEKPSLKLREKLAGETPQGSSGMPKPGAGGETSAKPSASS
jgi:peptidoglycan/LPS O-acetylase OafA/YrhL